MFQFTPAMLHYFVWWNAGAELAQKLLENIDDDISVILSKNSRISAGRKSCDKSDVFAKSLRYKCVDATCKPNAAGYSTTRSRWVSLKVSHSF